MKTPGILEGTSVAIIASLASGVLGALLPILVSNATSVRIVIASLALAYLLFLLKRSAERSGRVLMMVAWLIVTLGAWILDISLLGFVLSQATTIWIIRSLYFHSSILPTLLDLGLIAFGLTASAWAILQTGSVVLAIWCFFLSQSLFGLIPLFFFSLFLFPDFTPCPPSLFPPSPLLALDSLLPLSSPSYPPPGKNQ